MRLYPIAFALIVATTPARAVTATVAEFEACHADAARLCGPLSDGFFARARILACMISKRDQVSAKCKAVFAAHGF